MKKIASYILSSYSFIFSHPLDSLLHVGYESDDALAIPSFEEKLLIDLCTEAKKIFESERNLLEINGDVIVVGDIHGSLHDLLRIIKFANEKRSKVLFLGDYVDRGNFSLECITLLFAFKVAYPRIFYLIRGNHEFDSMCSQYGFKDEIINYHNPKILKNPPNQQKISPMDLKKLATDSLKFDDFYANYKDENCYKYSEALYDAFVNAFTYLPIAAIINKETFCIHGGLSPNLDQIDRINELIPRPINEFEDCPLLSDLVWSDPSYSPNCQFITNTRGRGYLFNIEAVNNFLRKNSLKKILRAHECVENGTLKNFGDKLMTIFSASSYDKYTLNNSGIIQLFEKDNKFKITTFLPLPRLQKSETMYCKVQPLNVKEDDILPCFSFRHPTLLSSNPTSRINQCKASSDNFTTIYSNQGKLVHLVRPKFTTNRRQSCHCIIRRPSFLDESPLNSDNDDGNEKIKIGSAPQHLTSSLYSFSDSTYIDE